MEGGRCSLNGPGAGGPCAARRCPAMPCTRSTARRCTGGFEIGGTTSPVVRVGAAREGCVRRQVAVGIVLERRMLEAPADGVAEGRERGERLTRPPVPAGLAVRGIARRGGPRGLAGVGRAPPSSASLLPMKTSVTWQRAPHSNDDCAVSSMGRGAPRARRSWRKRRRRGWAGRSPRCLHRRRH